MPAKVRPHLERRIVCMPCMPQIHVFTHVHTKRSRSCVLVYAHTNTHQLRPHLKRRKVSSPQIHVFTNAHMRVPNNKQTQTHTHTHTHTPTHTHNTHTHAHTRTRTQTRTPVGYLLRFIFANILVLGEPLRPPFSLSA